MKEPQIILNLGAEPLKECGVGDLDGTRCTNWIPTNRVACDYCLETLGELLNYMAAKKVSPTRQAP